MLNEENQKVEAKFRDKYGFFSSATGATAGVLVEVADNISDWITDNKSGLDSY
jgi:hypothetical protein